MWIGSFEAVGSLELISSFEAVGPLEPIRPFEAIQLSEQAVGSLELISSFEAVGRLELISSFEAIPSSELVGSFEAVGSLELIRASLHGGGGPQSVPVMKQSDDNRNTIDDTPLLGAAFCDTQLFEDGLSGANPAMEDGEVDRKVYFTHKSIGCSYRSD
ncbi:hypothetical protein pdam_00002363, partial [Pocillopora damicornis]